jgi:hypothetical protein
VGNFVTQKQLKAWGQRRFQICTRQKLLLAGALDGIPPLLLAVGFWQKQKQEKSPTKGTLNGV